jgi:hypothetical protein
MNNLLEAPVANRRQDFTLLRFASRHAPVAIGILVGAIAAFLLAWLCGTPLPF